MIASAAFESVGNSALGRYMDGSDLRPDLFQIAVTWAILKISGKWPISKQLSGTLDSENKIDYNMAVVQCPLHCSQKLWNTKHWRTFDGIYIAQYGNICGIIQYTTVSISFHVTLHYNGFIYF